MYLSNKLRRAVAKPTYPNIWDTLSKIQHTLHWADLELCEGLELSSAERPLLKTKRFIPNMLVIGRLVEKIGLSLDRIATGEIDYKALSERMGGNALYLPERYSLAAFSKRRTSINLLKYLEDHFHWNMKRNILNHFQLSEAIFSDPDANINFLFPTDLCEYMVRSGYSETIFPQMGAYSIATNIGTEAGNLIAALKTPKLVYEGVMLGLAENVFDRNCNYRILKLDDRECWIEANFTEELKDTLKLAVIGNKHVCSIRGGTFASLIGYLDLPFAKVTEVNCIHKGDHSCVYHVDYSEAQSLRLDHVN